MDFCDDGQPLRGALSDLLETQEVCSRRRVTNGGPSTGQGLDQLKRLGDRTSFRPQDAGLGADSIRLIAGNVDASPSS